jgi:transcriptional regulator with XRE-family HTH domain
MADTSKTEVKRLRDIHYFRQRFRNRVFGRLAAFFAEEAERSGVTRKDIASRLGRDPSQITRWLSQPSNLTIETISDLLLALDAEPEPPEIVRFSERVAPNYAHPLIARVMGVEGGNRPSPEPYVRFSEESAEPIVPTETQSRPKTAAPHIQLPA